MKKLITLIAAIPVLALFGGMGILAWRIGNTWDGAATQSLVTGLTVVCGSGALLFALLLACFIGIPLAIRAYGEAGTSRRQWSAPFGITHRSETQGSKAWDDPWRASSAPSFPDQRRLPPTIDGQWRLAPSPNSQGSAPTWAITGGSQSQLLAHTEQDQRFGMDHDAWRR